MFVARKILFIILDIFLVMILVSCICRYLGLSMQEVVDFFRPLIDEMIRIIQSLKGIFADRPLAM